MCHNLTLVDTLFSLLFLVTHSPLLFYMIHAAHGPFKATHKKREGITLG